MTCTCLVRLYGTNRPNFDQIGHVIGRWYKQQLKTDVVTFLESDEWFMRDEISIIIGV